MIGGSPERAHAQRAAPGPEDPRIPRARGPLVREPRRHPPLGRGLTAGRTAPPLGDVLPLWSVVPFALMLLAIALAPLIAPRLWERNSSKAIFSLLLGAPVAIWV